MNLNNANETLVHKPLSITILGAGAWGTALALLCARNGHNVTLWCFEPDVAHDITHNKCNERYLPGITFDAPITATSDSAHAVTSASWIIEAIPVAHMRSVLEQTRPFCNQSTPWIVTSKGIEQETSLLPTEIIKDVLGNSTTTIVLSGPSFARDVANKQPTTVDIGTIDQKTIQSLHTLFVNDYFSLVPCADTIGMQVGGALKNVIALGIGILDGAGYTDNAKASFITRGLAEMATLAAALGGHKETVYGLSGVGDLILTTTGALSKNLAIGKRIGGGEKRADIQKKSPQLPEGINTLKSVHHLAHRLKIDMPMCNWVYGVVFEGKSPDFSMTI